MIMVHTYEDVLLDAYASSPLLSSGSRAHPFIVQVLIWLGRLLYTHKKTVFHIIMHASNLVLGFRSTLSH